MGDTGPATIGLPLKFSGADISMYSELEFDMVLMMS